MSALREPIQTDPLTRNLGLSVALHVGLVVAFAVWKSSDVEAKKLTPPASQQETHDLYLQLTNLLSTAADDYQAGLTTGDQSLLQSGDQKYNQARILRILIQATLESAGV